MQLRRQSARLAKSSPGTSNTSRATSTVTSTPFSANSSARDTPPTSVVDSDQGTSTKGAPQRRKRTRSNAISDAEPGTEGVKLPAPKRRAVRNRVVVEIAKPAPTKIKGKISTRPPICESSDSEDEPLKKVLSAKAKGKARAASIDSSAEEDGSGLEYNDDIEESDDSGSEFVNSDDDSSQSDDEKDDSEQEERPSARGRKTLNSGKKPTVDGGSDVENEMFEEAVKMSLQTSLLTPATASSSSVQLARPSAASVLRAAAIERHLAGIEKGVDVDDSSIMQSDDQYSSDDSHVALADKRKNKGKGKSKRKKPVKAVPMAVTNYRTVAEMRRERRLEKRMEKYEEMELRKKLGRKLTHAERTSLALRKHHPELRDVWGDLEANIEVIKPTAAEQPAGLKLKLLPFQREGLFWMKKQEQSVWKGGMLADEMGMGKTIQIIALLISDAQRPNLVIAPTVAVMQWKNELESHTEGMKVLVWHGSGRESDTKELTKYDVVLTTYAVLESCFRKQESGFKRKNLIVKEKSPIHQIKWHRVILDEAHNIKERATNTAKATFELEADYRWCLSGTPLQNRVGELYSLVRFLGGDPFSYYFCKCCPCKSLHWSFKDKRTCDDCGHSPMQHNCFWNTEILTPIQKNGMAGPGVPAFKKLRILLDRMMLRRTKLQRADDLGLPPRTVIVKRDYFSPEEKELYLSLFSDAKRTFNTYLDQGTILNNYSNIFSLLTRMRQMACHPDLVLRSKTNASNFVPDEGEATVCRLCNDVAEDAIQSKCHHIFDRECMRQYLSTVADCVPVCPVCYIPLTIDLDAPAIDLNENVNNAHQGILGRLNLATWRSSTKIEALVEELSKLRQQDASTKSIVFSQFVNFLDLIAYRLQNAGFNICRLSGTMSPQARDATIKYFMNNVEVTVFLVSLKAGGVALNLTEASRVYLMDSWWNPAVEFQAMDRIHRLGQHRPVHAIKLVVEDSIESRIVQLQEKKAAMVDATLSADDQAMGRLTPEDLGFLFRL